MKYLFALVMLWVMMNSTLVIPSLLPHPTYIALAGMIVLLLWQFNFSTNTRLNPRILFVIGLYLSIVLLICPFMEIELFVWIRQIVMFSALAIILLTATRDQLELLLKGYVLFCILMSLCGATASLLINTSIINWQDHLYSLSENTNNRIVWDQDVVYGYSFPYGLGLVLTSSFLYSFMGIDFYRSSGWAHEPTAATFFIVPALILLVRENIFSWRIRITGIFSIVSFYLSCFAVGSIIALVSLIICWDFLKPKRRFPFFGMALLACFLLAAICVYSSFISGMLQSTNSGAISILQSKFEPGNASMTAVVSPLYGDSLFLLLIISYILIALYYSLIALRDNPKAQTFSLIFIYLLMHSAKGSWGHLTQYLFTFIFFFLLVYSLYSPHKFRLFTRPVI
jgi:hypothetical protein